MKIMACTGKRRIDKATQRIHSSYGVRGLKIQVRLQRSAHVQKLEGYFANSRIKLERLSRATSVRVMSISHENLSYVSRPTSALYSGVPRLVIAPRSPTFHQDRALDPTFCRRQEINGWMALLAAKLTEMGLPVTTPDIALGHVKTGYWDARDLFLVDESRGKHTAELLSLGARGLATVALESPFYAHLYYDDIERHVAGYEAAFLCKGFHTPPLAPKARLLHYPAFFTGDSHPPLPWEQRKFLCMIAANKHYHLRVPTSAQWRHIKKYLDERNRRLSSPTYVNELPHMLHDKRMEAVIHFGTAGKLDLYGAGWEKLKNLPLRFKRPLAKILPRLAPKPVPDKLAVLRGYRYSICFENQAFPGYVTEKIFDCLRAGVIPIYLGAPDISDYVDPAAFIDCRNFADFTALERYLENLSQQEAERMIAAGAKFLDSPSGFLFSHENFAQTVFNAIRPHLPVPR